MTTSQSRPVNIEDLEWAVWPSFALLAGIRLDLFAPLKDGPLSAELLADKLGVESTSSSRSSTRWRLRDG